MKFIDHEGRQTFNALTDTTSDDTEIVDRTTNHITFKNNIYLLTYTRYV